MSVKWSLFFNESNSLRLEFKWASKQLLILNIELKTDRKQVVWTKAEKNFERRVKKNWNFDRLKITIISKWKRESKAWDYSCVFLLLYIKMIIIIFLFQKNPIELKVSNVKICYFFSMIEWYNKSYLSYKGI